MENSVNVAQVVIEMSEWTDGQTYRHVDRNTVLLTELFEKNKEPKEFLGYTK